MKIRCSKRRKENIKHKKKNNNEKIKKGEMNFQSKSFFFLPALFYCRLTGGKWNLKKKKKRWKNYTA